MGYLNTLITSEAISGLFETHAVLTCNEIEKYCLENKCYPEAYNGMGEHGKPEDQLRQLIDFSIFFLLNNTSGEIRQYPDPAIEPFDMTKKQKQSLKVFISSEWPDYDEVYKIKFRKTKAWKNKKVPAYEGIDL
jgi:hypothetical protein